MDKGKIIHIGKEDLNFQCVDPEGVLEITKILEAALTKKPPYVFQVDDGTSQFPKSVSREEYLQFYIEMAVESINELIVREE